MKKFLKSFLALGLLAGATASAAELTVYSHRHYDSDAVLFKQFTEETGIKVNVVKASADQLIQRLASEGKNSPADVLLTGDAGRLHRAKAAGVLQPVNALLRPHAPATKAERTATRLAWEVYHKGSGYLAVVLALELMLMVMLELTQMLLLLW